MQSWSIFVMCYNEENTILRVVTDAYEMLDEMTDTFEIVVVDDGSADKSLEIVKDLEKKLVHLRHVAHGTNKGIGATLRSGYTNTQYENVCAIPGDGQFDIKELIPFKEIAEETFISFYRKENTSYSLFRNILSWFNKQLNKLLLNLELRDVNWVKIYKGAAIRSLDLTLESSLVESEICAKLLVNGSQPKEIQSKYLERQSGQSRGASLKVVMQALREILTLWYELRRYKKNN